MATPMTNERTLAGEAFLNSLPVDESGRRVLSPPTLTCLREDCHRRQLNKPATYPAIAYTLRLGAVALTIRSLYCRDCRTRYAPDYYVREPIRTNAQRVYYKAPPPVIGISEHFFADLQLCDWIGQQFLWAHASSEHIARIYNHSIHGTAHLAKLTAEVVLDAFFLDALLQWCHSQSTSLSVPHNGSKSDRFDAAMCERNRFMSGTGQEHWYHACDTCSKFKLDASGRRYRITACVMDGICIGHACCSFKDEDGMPCRHRLQTGRDRFCPVHMQNQFLCAVRACESAREAGFQTCTLSDHRALENSLPKPGSSMMQLLARREKNKNTPSPSKRKRTTAKQSKVKAVFRRTFTHNEQLLVRPCGVIISRCTMYQSEAVSAVKDFVMNSFPETFPGSKPTYLFYDNNCQLQRYIASPGHPKVQAYFELIHRPVDVFHFFCKHSEEDEICQTHCNPALFPDLITDGRWTFNTSAAEQVNAWLVKYKTIVREMEETRYNFFLDELISLRNKYTVATLDAKGRCPHFIPSEDLENPVFAYVERTPVV